MISRIQHGRLFAPSALALALAVLAPTGGLAAKTYKRGEFVTVTGRVTGAGGVSLPEVTVVLELTRTSFKLGNVFKRDTPARQKGNTLQIPATSDPDGDYSLTWRWDPYYDTFALAVGLQVRMDDREAFEVFHRQDITAAVRQGSPVVISPVIQDTAYLDWLRRFLSDQASADERRIFRELGRPDRIDQEQRPRAIETAWWYFAEGKVYRFRDGGLDRVIHFEPIPPVE